MGLYDYVFGYWGGVGCWGVVMFFDFNYVKVVGFKCFKVVGCVEFGDIDICYGGCVYYGCFFGYGYVEFVNG